MSLFKQGSVHVALEGQVCVDIACLSVCACMHACAISDLSEALDSLVDFLFGYANRAVKIATRLNAVVLFLGVNGANCRALKTTQSWLLQQLLCYLQASVTFADNKHYRSHSWLIMMTDMFTNDVDGTY